MYRLRVYLASGWFTPNQQSTYEKLSKILHMWEDKFDVFYPKGESSQLQNKLHLASTRDEIFNKNLQGMENADFIVCSTEDKDTGSIFESGYCYKAKKPIIYVNFNLGKAPFNLMLTESSLAVARDERTFEKILHKIVQTKQLDHRSYEEFRRENTVE